MAAPDSTTLFVASSNHHKVREIEGILRPLGRFGSVIGIDQFSAPIPFIEECGSTFMENAELKVKGWAHWLKERGQAGHDWVLADDSGVCIDALDGRPGIYSARFAGEGATDAMNNQHLVEQLKRKGVEWSDAHYMCALAIARVDRASIQYLLRSPSAGEADGHAIRAGDLDDPTMLRVWGRCDGEISVFFSGQGGFGYDPHFWIDRRRCTFAQLSAHQKATKSHRGAALRNLAKCLSTAHFQPPQDLDL